MSKEKMNKRIDTQKAIRVFLLGLYDALAVLVSAFLALYIRFDMHFSAIDSKYLEAALLVAPVTILATWIIFKIEHLYDSLWNMQVSGNCFFFNNLLCACCDHPGSLYNSGGSILCTEIFSFPVSFAFFLLLVVGSRFSYRAIRLFRWSVTGNDGKGIRNIMVIGAGQAGRLIVEEIKHSNEMDARVCCIIDDDRAKKGKYLRGVEIVGDRDCIISAVEKYNINQIILAMPSASRRTQKEILDICKETECEMKIVPGIYQMINGDVLMSKLRKVEVEDLLGRDPIKVNADDIFNYITGKTILVTGGGGSIGSELCRQIAAHQPETLVIFDVYENNAYDIQMELRKNYPDMHLETIIGSVRDSRKIFQVFEQFHPDIVYHAAAHKHVPLMEDSPCEAIKK